MYVSSQLALRLRGSQSFHSCPLIIRAGGLSDALGPEVATRNVNSQTGDMSLHCEGWSCLFVPNNENYEGSMRLLFAEHNHPVSKEEEKKMTPAQRQRCQWHRCYRAVFLLHCDRSGERFVIAGLRVLRADQAEGPALWELLDTFVGAVGRGILKVLLVDRGFIDGSQIGKLKTEYGVDTVIPVRKNMDILQDVRGIVKLGVRWEEYQRPHREPLTSPRPKHPTAAKREKARRKALAKARRLMNEDHLA